MQKQAHGLASWAADLTLAETGLVLLAQAQWQWSAAGEEVTTAERPQAVQVRPVLVAGQLAAAELLAALLPGSEAKWGAP